VVTCSYLQLLATLPLQFGFLTPDLHSVPRAYCLSAMLVAENMYIVLALIVSPDSLVIMVSAGKEEWEGVNFYTTVC